MLCAPLRNAEDFLRIEKQEVMKQQSNRPSYEVFISKTLEDEGLWYSFTNTGELKIDEGSWVEIYSERFSLYGSLWFSDKRKCFYLITDSRIPEHARVKIRLADEVQLVLMQEEALRFLQESQTEQCVTLKNLICGKYFLKEEKLEKVSFYNENLTDSQKNAVIRSLSLDRENPFFLIHGPPGTGKTTVIAEIVRQLRNRGKNILITSHTNVAVDNALEKLLPDYRSYELGSKIVRLGLRAKVTDKRLRDLVPVKDEELVKLRTAQVVGATLSKVSMLKMCNKISWANPFFDVVIVDESSMATIPLTLVGVLSGKHFILVGDHKQLPPITTQEANKVLNENEEYESLFRLLIEKYPKKSIMLDVQYRSHPEIFEFSSRYFYDGKIKSAPECLQKVLALQKMPFKGIVPGTLTGEPVICVNTEGVFGYPIGWVEYGSKKNRSYFNQYEAAVALAIMDELLRYGVSANQICIITPYRLQSRIIRRTIKIKYGRGDIGEVFSLSGLSASTVDAFQGKESDVVIYCITWTPKNKNEDLHIALRNWRRLNVALTRARRKLIIIGSITSLHEYPFSALYQFLSEKKRIIKCPDVSNFADFLKLVMECYETITQKEKGEQHTQITQRESPPEDKVHVNRMPITKPPELANIRPLISANDFVEYGKVYRYLQDHPDASTGEIAKDLRMPIDRVYELIRLINYEKSKNAESK